MRASLEWGHDLLSEPERILFRRLAVFNSDFMLEWAEAVCAGGGIDVDEVMDVLAGLVERSMVVAHQVDDEVRYSLLESHRTYAAELLVHAGEADAVEDRHQAWLASAA